MRPPNSNNRLRRLGLAAILLVAVAILAAVACDGDGGPNITPEPDVTPGAGISPVEAVGTYINLNGLDGHGIDVTTLADCPLEDVIATPGIVARVAVAQFCFTARDLVPEESIIMAVELPETGEVWDFDVEYDAETSTWSVSDIKKISE